MKTQNKTEILPVAKFKEKYSTKKRGTRNTTKPKPTKNNSLNQFVCVKL
jgi:hypothetical protein